MVSNPEIMKKQAKAREAKRKREEKKAASKRANPPQKKAKTSATTNTVDDESDNQLIPSPTITAYALIPKKTPANSSKGKGRKTANTDDNLQKGPFTFNSTDTYETFLAKLAGALSCRVENINQNKIQWRPKKPATTPLLILGAAAGFHAMVDEMSSRKPGDRTILLSMPPPIEPMEAKIVCAHFCCFFTNPYLAFSRGPLAMRRTIMSQDLTMTNLSM